MANFAVILAAAGKSTRFGDLFYKKVYAPLAGRPVWVYSAEFFNNRPDVLCWLELPEQAANQFWDTLETKA